MPESDLEVTAMLSRATWKGRARVEKATVSRTLEVGRLVSRGRRVLVLSALPRVPLSRTGMRGLQVMDGTFYYQKTDLLTPPPSPPLVVQLGVTGVPPVERSVAMQVCSYTVSTRQGQPCLLFRACRYSSGLIRRGLCGLWRGCST